MITVSLCGIGIDRSLPINFKNSPCSVNPILGVTMGNLRIAMAWRFVSVVGISLMTAVSTAQDDMRLPDRDLQKSLVGRWKWHPTSKFLIDITFAADQSFKATEGMGDFGYNSSGAWKVEAGKLAIVTKRVWIGDKGVDVEDPRRWSMIDGGQILAIDGENLKLFNARISKSNFEFKRIR